MVDDVQAYAIRRVQALGREGSSVTTVMHGGDSGTIAMASSLPSRAAVRGVLTLAVGRSLAVDGVDEASSGDVAVADLEALQRGGKLDS